MLKQNSNKQGKVSQINSRNKNKFEKNMASLAVVVHLKSNEMVELEVLQLEYLTLKDTHL